MAKITETTITSANQDRHNANKGTERGEAALDDSLTQFGAGRSLLMDKNGDLIAGNKTQKAAIKAGLTRMIVVETTGDEVVAVKRMDMDLSSTTDKRARQLAYYDNQVQALDYELDLEQLVIDLDNGVGLTGLWNEDEMAELLEQMADGLLGGGEGEGEGDEDNDGEGGGVGYSLKSTGKLDQLFGYPPFSILDSRQGKWQDRKRHWTGIGINSGDGRESDLLAYDSLPKLSGSRENTGTSVFDPVLAELMYSWFSPVDGVILDPFAGGSVRGIVAGVLGRNYTGVDLRPEQVEANDKQAAICKEIKNTPKWITGDSRNIDELCNGVKADFVFSCPPYYDLEQYGDDPNDLSKAKTYQDFLADYRLIISKAIGLLNDNRFACFVVGDIRDKKGFYCNFVSDTIAAFQDAGAKLYNEAILVNISGNWAVRIGKVFKSGRKLGKTHQNVLIFCKGDFKIATQNLGDVVVYDMDGNEVNDDESADGVSGGKLPNGVEEL